MTIQKAVTILEKHNKWRRGDDNLDQADPTELGIAIDLITEYFEVKMREAAQNIIEASTCAKHHEQQENYN